MTSKHLGFIGLGAMGEAMAMNLVVAGVPLLIWNRTFAKTATLAAAGAYVADDASEVFAQATTIILMLANEAAINAVLDREGPNFKTYVRDHTIIHMGTTSPAYSSHLEREIRQAGGHYVEAPVSGSRKPAEKGKLVAMLAGDADTVKAVRPLLAPMCHEMVFCGAVPSALLMKLAINLFLIALVTGLAEAVHFAECNALDLSLFSAVLEAGPMASDVSRVKLPKLINRDFSVQGAISNVLENNRLIAEAARQAGIASPLLDVCHALYGETLALGFQDADMIAVLEAIAARSRLP